MLHCMYVLDRHIEVDARALDDLIELSWRAVDCVRDGIPDRLLADAFRGAVSEVATHRHEV